MTPADRDSVVLITSSEPAIDAFGTGFVVHRDEQGSYVVTCAHVIRDVGGPETTKAADLPATVVAIGDDDVLDLAVVRVPGLLDKQTMVLQIEAQEGAPFIAVGF